MRRTKPVAAPMVARVYLRVSTDAQDLERQEAITTAAKAAGYYVAGIYREKASGARADRPELLRMIGDLQPGEVVIAEKIDRQLGREVMGIVQGGSVSWQLGRQRGLER